MSKSSKNKQSNPRVRSRSKPKSLFFGSTTPYGRLVGGVIFAVAMSIFGTYIVLRSDALTVNNNQGGVMLTYSTDRGPSGNEIYYNGTANIQIMDSTNSPVQLVYAFAYDAAKIEVQTVTCGSSGSCYKSTFDSLPYTRHGRNLTVCVNIAQTSYSYVGLFTIAFKRLTPQPYSDSLFVSRTFLAPGSCTSNPSAQGAQQIGGSGGCDGDAYGGPVWCDLSASPGSGPGFVGFGDGAGTGQTPLPGTRSSQSPSGTSRPSKARATSRSTQPNPLQTASSQGEQRQPSTVEPSPFYDGKQYSLGSNEDKQSIKVASLLSKNATNIWLYIVLSVVIISIGGMAVWSYRSHKK